MTGRHRHRRQRLDECATLRELRASLSASRADWLALAAREKKFQAILSETQLPSVQPDATAEQILALLVAEKRIQIIRGFLASTGSVRTAIRNRAASAFFALNKLILKFSTERIAKKFFLSGTEPVPVITDALEVIEKLLSK